MLTGIKAEIAHKLREFSQQRGIEILYAVEAGSRVWGFNHKGSDYDVRFIFRYPDERYLRLSKPKDVLQFSDNTKQGIGIEYHGWDIYKTLSLLRKYNPSLLEWVTAKDKAYIRQVADINDLKYFDELLYDLYEDNFSVKCGFSHIGLYKEIYKRQSNIVKATLHAAKAILSVACLVEFDMYPVLNVYALAELLAKDTDEYLNIACLLDSVLHYAKTNGHLALSVESLSKKEPLILEKIISLQSMLEALSVSLIASLEKKAKKEKGVRIPDKGLESLLKIARKLPLNHYEHEMMIHQENNFSDESDNTLDITERW